MRADGQAVSRASDVWVDVSTAPAGKEGGEEEDEDEEEKDEGGAVAGRHGVPKLVVRLAEEQLLFEVEQPLLGADAQCKDRGRGGSSSSGSSGNNGGGTSDCSAVGRALLWNAHVACFEQRQWNS